MIYQTVLALATASVVSATTLYTEDRSIQNNLWNHFKSQFAKTYQNNDEENHRFTVFLHNLKVADERNELESKLGGSAVHGVTQFSDLSQDEFEKQFLNADISKALKGEGIIVPNIESYPLNTTGGFVDWTGRLTTPVKNQGACGSCWAFSAAEQIESDAMRTLGVYAELSAGQINDCDSSSYGCGGGWTTNAYNYVRNAGGIEMEYDYPYTSGNSGQTGQCHADGSKFKFGVSGYTQLDNENSMGGFVEQAGPLSICLDASNFNSYTGGVVYSCGNSVNHCIQAVGVQVDNYWKVRNQWGTGWGEGGYMRIVFGQNMCNLASTPTYVNVYRK